MPSLRTEHPTASTEFKDNHIHEENCIRQDQQGSKQHHSILRNKVILSILVTETAERVAYFGFRAVLVLYFTNGLQFSESTSVSLFASVSGLAYLSPLLGAILADSVWGRYQTIWRFGTLYSIGMCLIALGAYQLGPPLPISFPISMNGSTDDCGDVSDELNRSRTIVGENLLIARSLNFVGLLFVCIGTGGIKPCVSAFGADQVVLSDSRESDTLPSTNTYSDGSHEDLSGLILEPNSFSVQEATPVRIEKQTSTSVFVQHTKDDNIREFFNSFYFCINVGALLSFALIPMVRAKFGFGAAFLIPSIFMIGALVIFLSQRKAYKHRRRDSSQPSLSTTLYLCWAIVFAKTYGHYTQINVSTTQINDIDFPVPNANNRVDEIEDNEPEAVIRAPNVHLSENEIDVNNSRVRRDAEQVLHLMPLMLFFPVFWMLYDQQGSVWTLQATRLNRYGLEPEQTGVCVGVNIDTVAALSFSHNVFFRKILPQFLNPLEIMLFIPLFDKILYPWLEDKGFNIQPLKRMEYGMFLGAVAFFASALLEYSIQRGPPNSISLAWQIPQITILTVAEILLNVTGLEVSILFYKTRPFFAEFFFGCHLLVRQTLFELRECML